MIKDEIQTQRMQRVKTNEFLHPIKNINIMPNIRNIFQNMIEIQKQKS